MSLNTANAETPKTQSLLVTQLREEHIGMNVTFFYFSSKLGKYTKREGKLERYSLLGRYLTVEVNDSDSQFKTFAFDKIPHQGAIAVY